MRDHNKTAVNTTHLYHKHLKVLGILIAKSATTSTTNLFRDSYGFKRLKDIDYDYEKVKNAWSFAFVRNPWDRLVSTYHSKVENSLEPCFQRHPEYNIVEGMTFPSFIKRIQRLSYPPEWWDALNSVPFQSHAKGRTLNLLKQGAKPVPMGKKRRKVDLAGSYSQFQDHVSQQASQPPSMQKASALQPPLIAANNAPMLNEGGQLPSQHPGGSLLGARSAKAKRKDDE